jgi:hypothetical protein
LPWLLCPDSWAGAYSDAADKQVITNYKVMGATHVESLSVASPHPLTPKYNPSGKRQGIPVHPDGACFPGASLPVSSILDGTANTVLAAEIVSTTIWARP